MFRVGSERPAGVVVDVAILLPEALPLSVFIDPESAAVVFY
jgi:hypothetical protein